MPREFNRSERVAGQMRRELARLIQQDLKDPSLGFVSVSDVEVTRDLSHAKVFVTVFEPERADDSPGRTAPRSGIPAQAAGPGDAHSFGPGASFPS